MKTDTKTLTVTPEAHRVVRVTSAQSECTATQLASAYILDTDKRVKAGKVKIESLLKEVAK